MDDMDDDDRGKPEHAGSKKHKVVLNLDRQLWTDLEAAAEADGVEPKDFIEKLVAEHLSAAAEPAEPAA